MSLDKLIEDVMEMGEKKGATLYNILFRNAGWGIMWYDEPHLAREIAKLHRDTLMSWSKKDKWRLGKVVYQYKPTLVEALREELVRLAALPDYVEPGPSSLPQSKDLEQS